MLHIQLNLSDIIFWYSQKTPTILDSNAIFIMRYYFNLETEAVYIEDLRTEYVNYAPSKSVPGSEASSTSSTTKESILPENIMRYITINDYPVPYQIINFNALREYQNSDIYAWITIPDCTIDYPIVQHPTDNNYYIDHNLNGSSGYPGCIYTENYNTTSWNDSNTGIFNKTVTLDGTSKILTLSTCIKNQNEKRFLVQAVLVGEGGIE